jgi:cytochrome c biogenesis protein CcmG/thiol:disulfide interchange protein DsbE
LADQGDPYQFNVVDEQRSLIFDLGVTGAPETFILDKTGTIRYHHIGDINPQNWPTLASVIKQLEEGADGQLTP